MPNNWLSRWAIVLGGLVAVVAHLLLYVIEGCQHKALTLLAVASLLGACIVGAVNVHEDYALHFFGAGTLFAGYDLYMLVKTLAALVALRNDQPTGIKGGGSRASNPRAQLALLTLALSSTALTSVRHVPGIAHALGPAAVSHLEPRAVLLPVLEWINAACLLLYFALSILSHGEAARSTSFCVGPDPHGAQHVLPLEHGGRAPLITCDGEQA